MARSVVASRPNPLATLAYGLPCLSERALEVYSTLLRDRLEKFPQPQQHQKRYLLEIPEEVGSLPWAHELRHDGESVFWLLVWWAIHLRPKHLSSSKSDPPSEIDSFTYMSLTDIDLAKRRDFRGSFMQELANEVSWLDPAYRELEPLFLQMARQLTGDLYWANRATKNPDFLHPDFLHEALQRIIFNFLMENRAKDFMHCEKDSNHRVVKRQIQQHGYKQGPTPTKRTHSTMTDDPDAQVEVSLLSSPALVHLTYSCRFRQPKRHVGTTSEPAEKMNRDGYLR